MATKQIKSVSVGCIMVRGMTISVGTEDIQAALNAASSAGKTLLINPGVYQIEDELLIPSNITILAYGARFEVYDPALGSAGNLVGCVSIKDASNVRVAGLEIDGRKAAWGSTEYKPGFQVMNSSDVYLDDVWAHDCKGDGLILFAESPGTDHNEHIFVRQGRFTANYRGGIAITDVDTAVLDQCIATHNDGTAPRFGLDIEPDADAAICRNVLVVGGDYSFNGGSVSGEGAGIYVAHRSGGGATQRGVRIIGARMRGNAIHGLICGLNPTVARDVEVIGCEISENAAQGGGGAEFRGGENFRMIGCHLRDNAAFGVSVGVVGQTATNTTILDTFVRGDDTAGAIWSFGGTVDGLLIDGLVTENNAWGIRLGSATVTDLRIGARNLLKDNSVADFANLPATALFEPIDLKASKTFDWPNINAGSQSTTTVTATGAALGDGAEASMSVDLQGMQLTAYVSASNTVTCVMRNGTGGAINLASGTLRVRVRKT